MWMVGVSMPYVSRKWIVHPPRDSAVPGKHSHISPGKHSHYSGPKPLNVSCLYQRQTQQKIGPPDVVLYL